MITKLFQKLNRALVKANSEDSGEVSRYVASYLDTYRLSITYRWLLQIYCQALRFILSLRLYSSFITSRPDHSDSLVRKKMCKQWTMWSEWIGLLTDPTHIVFVVIWNCCIETSQINTH